MLFKRVLHTAMNQGIPVRSGVGTGIFSNVRIATKTEDAAYTLTVDDMAGGVVQFTSLSAGRVVTTPTAADILAAATDMDVGDAFQIVVSAVAAFAITWAAGTGVTLAGRATTPASSSTSIFVRKTSSTTVTWTVL
jgi:uncharacterized membrane protein (DUF441 family)